MSSTFEFDPDRMAGSGLITRGTAGEALTGHQLVYQGANGRWYLADADAAAYMPVIGLTLYTITAGNRGQILLHGYIGLASWTWTVGGTAGLIYASTTPGELTQTAPAAPGDLTQIVGTATAPNIIYFNPFPPSEGIGLDRGVGDFTYLIERDGADYEVYNDRGLLVHHGTDGDTEINWALTTGGTGCVVYLREDTTFVINDPITFTANSQVIRGGGRSSFIDGDTLATGEHGIVLSGFDNCIMRDFSIQTQDGGTKTCHCIFIEDGADNFLIEHVDFIDSDDNCVHVEGTTINIGYIDTCHFDGADGYGVYVNMDGGNTMNRLNIINNDMVGIGNAGVYFDASAGNYYCVIESNIIAASGGIGIYVNDFISGQIVRNECLLGGLSGIHVVGSTSINVTDNQCLLNERHGIFFTSATTDSLIAGNVCNDNDDHDTATYDGINLDTDCSGNIITNNVCERNHNRGIVVRSIENLISNNKAAENDRAGIYVNQVGNTINDNRVLDNGQDAAGTYHGIHLGTLSSGCQISGNYVDGYGDSQEDGIYLETAVDNCQIEGNYCYDGMGSGITLVDDNDDTHIIDNHCNSNDDYGIEIITANADRTFCKNNKLVGNVTGQFLDNGTDTATPFVDIEAPNPDSNVGDHPTMQMSDGVDTIIRFGCYVPLEFQELVTAQIVVVQTATAGPPNMQWSTTTDWGKLCAGENYNAGSDFETDQTTAVAQNNLVCIDVSGSLAGIAAGDKIGFTFIRRATQAGDTINAVAYFLEFRMRYV